MKILNYIPALLAALLILNGCSSSKEARENANAVVEPVELHAWIDLMPGKPSTFHFSGVIKITNKTNEELSGIKLQNVEVRQGGNAIYKFKPNFSASSGLSKSILPGDAKLFKFNSEKGLRRTGALKPDVPVRALLLFSSDKMNFNYTADSLEIKKVY